MRAGSRRAWESNSAAKNTCDRVEAETYHKVTKWEYSGSNPVMLGRLKFANFACKIGWELRSE